MRYSLITEVVPALHPEATATQRFLVVEKSPNGVGPRVVATGFYKDPLAELVRLANIGAGLVVKDRDLAERLVAITPGL